MKYLIWLGLGVAVWLAWKVFAGKAREAAKRAMPDQADPNQAGSGKPKASAPAPAIEAMSRCAHCHAYFPDSEAVKEGAQVFCSSAHRKLGAAPHA
jgi:uncharacterized protein